MEKGLNVHMKALSGYEAHKLALAIDMHNPTQKIACPICKHNHLQIERKEFREVKRGTVFINCPNCGMGTHFTTN